MGPRRALPPSSDGIKASGNECVQRADGRSKGKPKRVLHHKNVAPFRTLVVVPHSHVDGTFERLVAGGKRKAQCKDPKVARRAVQLDFRPNAANPHKSLFIAWDSRVVHQGHTHRPHDCGWHPPLHRPPIFPLDATDSWRRFVDEDGYVAVANILPPAHVQEALKLLLRDIQRLCPEIRNLDQVREKHLPHSSAANDLRAGAGLCHGEFAWYIRTHPNVAKVFEHLFKLAPGAELCGSVDVVALAPPGSAAACGKGKQWLHVDYNPPEGTIWQACVQLFPDAKEHGAGWERIAVMVCKAPASWAKPVAAEQSLLACCVTGRASRATAGVTLGLMHAEARREQEPGSRRLLAALAQTPIAVATVGKSNEVPMSQLRSSTPRKVMRLCNLTDLRRLVPEQVLKYVAPQSVRDSMCGLSGSLCQFLTCNPLRQTSLLEFVNNARRKVQTDVPSRPAVATQSAGVRCQPPADEEACPARKVPRLRVTGDAVEPNADQAALSHPHPLNASTCRLRTMSPASGAYRSAHRVPRLTVSSNAGSDKGSDDESTDKEGEVPCTRQTKRGHVPLRPHPLLATTSQDRMRAMSPFRTASVPRLMVTTRAGSNDDDVDSDILLFK